MEMLTHPWLQLDTETIDSMRVIIPKQYNSVKQEAKEDLKKYKQSALPFVLPSNSKHKTFK